METQQLPPNQNTAETKAQPPQTSSKNKLFWVVVISVLLAAITSGSVVYFWQKSANNKAINSMEQKITSLEKQISTVNRATTKSQPTSSPEPLSSHSADPTANWSLYVDPQNKFEFLYPPTYTLGKLGDRLPLLNHKIYWKTSQFSYKDCRGGCAIVDSTEKVTVANRGAVKIKGWTGSVGGNIPQSYIKYEIPTPDSNYLVFILWELPQDGNQTQYAHGREIQPISLEEEQVFDKIVSTLQFSNTVETTPTSQPVFPASENAVQTSTSIPSANDSFSLGNGMGDNPLSIINNTLKVKVGYSGGCKEHEFKLMWEGMFLESTPVQVELYLIHDSKGDKCEAYIQETLEFDLNPLKKSYNQAYQSSEGTIIIHVYGSENKKESINYKF
jgi:hypothetical protein